MNERRDNIKQFDTMIPLDEVGNQAVVARPPTPPRRRGGGSPSRLLENNLAEATSECGRGILKKNREEIKLSSNQLKDRRRKEEGRKVYG